MACDFDILALASVCDLNKENEVERNSDSNNENESDSEEKDEGGSRKRMRVFKKKMTLRIHVQKTLGS